MTSAKEAWVESSNLDQNIGKPRLFHFLRLGTKADLISESQRIQVLPRLGGWRKCLNDDTFWNSRAQDDCFLKMCFKDNNPPLSELQVPSLVALHWGIQNSTYIWSTKSWLPFRYTSNSAWLLGISRPLACIPRFSEPSLARMSTNLAQRKCCLSKKLRKTVVFDARVPKKSRH